MEKKKVLIVEDDALLRTALVHQFEEAGFDVSAAGDGEEGLSHWKSWGPAAVILDVMLPKKTGVEMLEEMQEEEAGKVPVFMLTNTDDIDYVSRAIRSGAVAYIKKSDDAASRVVEEVTRKLKD
jgi:DNA-binding response OmpR family regulator